MENTEIVEVRRYHFRSPIDIRSALSGFAYQLARGNQYRIQPKDYDRVVRLLRRQVGIKVLTMKDVFAGLTTINYREIRQSPFWEPVDNPEQWTFLSPITRRWRRCLANNTSIQVRPGWVLAYHPDTGRTDFFLVQKGQKPKEWKTRGDLAIQSAYSGVLGRLPVPFWKNEDFLFAIWPGYVIPKDYEVFLTRTLSPLTDPLPSDEGEAIWTWHPEDKDIVEIVMRRLNLRLTPWESEKNWVPTASLVMKRSYGNYLRRRGGAEELRKIVHERGWHKIEDESLKETIKKLSSAEWNGDNFASALLQFLEDRVCVDFDWQKYGQSIEGWVIESSPVSYLGKSTGSRYYRVVLPRFEVVVGWQSRAQPDWEGNTRLRVKINHWRCAPLVGRLKIAGAGETPEPSVAGRGLRDISLQAILGIPQIEWSLAKQLTVGAFILDLDGANWRGCNDMCRYFSGYGRIVSINPSEIDGHGLLLEDALGKKFALETSGLKPNQLQGVGEWVHFVAHSSMLHHQAWQMLNRDVPVFSLKMEHLFRRSFERNACRDSIYAYIKYYFGIEKTEIVKAFKNNWPLETINLLLDDLVKEGLIIEESGKLYYRYQHLSTRDMAKHLRNEQNIGEEFGQIRTLLHPLFVRTINLNHKALLIPKDRFASVRKVGIKSTLDDSALTHQLEKELVSTGVLVFGGLGQQAKRSTSILHSLVGGNPSLQIRRYDGTHTFSDGDQVQSVNYLVRDPVRLLALKYK